MRTIIHLSDLHFGKVEKKRILPLVELVNSIKPDLVIISGDLTQRATHTEYKEAKNFIKKIKPDKFIVPGNHDIPLINVFARLTRPFKKYTNYITKDLSPRYEDKELSIVGLNSVRPYTISSGRLSKTQVKNTLEVFNDPESKKIKIVVCHHPFDLPHKKKGHHKHTHKVIGSSVPTMTRLASKKVDLFLSGHLHVTHIGDTTHRYNIKGYSGLIVQAGTALSKRIRGELVSFNVLKIEPKYIEVDCYTGDEIASGYNLSSVHKYKKGHEGWKQLS
jgi:3',5'-cyclic AMP phosphodiesterase CpdA